MSVPKSKRRLAPIVDDAHDDDDDFIGGAPVQRAWGLGCTLRRQFVRCGKADCAQLHGPYWYGFVRVGKRQRSIYFGKECPTRDEVEAKIRKLEREQASTRTRRKASRAELARGVNAKLVKRRRKR